MYSYYSRLLKIILYNILYLFIFILSWSWHSFNKIFLFIYISNWFIIHFWL